MSYGTEEDRLHLEDQARSYEQMTQDMATMTDEEWEASDQKPRTSTMTRDQAQMFRAAYEGAVKRYSKMTKVQLRNEWLIALSQAGMESLYGGPSSKDELISATLHLRGYTIAKLNETIHVLGHDVTWPDCEWCQAESHLSDSGVVRDTDGTILRGLSLPCGCPLDADCNGYHAL